MLRFGATFLMLVVTVAGCAGKSPLLHTRASEALKRRPLASELLRKLPPEAPAARDSDDFRLTGHAQAVESTDDSEKMATGMPDGVLRLEQVIESVYRSYPLLEAANYARDVAAGEHISAQGAFDLQITGASENGAAGFYETYRQRAGVVQPLFGGGLAFGGYRVGRGNFQPWFLERQTDDGGEFRAGIALPVARNVDIDARRANLWRTDLGRELAEPEIRLQRIAFVRAASYAYWEWVAAGRRLRIAESLLRIAENRNDAIRRKVETGDTDPPVLQDNRRLIVSREAMRIDAERKIKQAAIQLSLFLRDELGKPQVANADMLPEMSVPQAPDESAQEADVQEALSSRPELGALNLVREQLQIDLEQARNEVLPDVQVVVAASQDVGDPATPKNDKSLFELEAGVFVDVPLQRRRALGKVAAAEGKLSQVAPKARMLEDKIAAEVRAVYAALLAAHQRIARARESVQLANRLADIERRRFELGESDLLSVNLREQQAAEAQFTEVDALFEYNRAQADHRAVLARE